MPIRFPGNVAVFVNGSAYRRPLSEAIPKSDLPEVLTQLSFGVEGFIAQQQYESMLKQQWFGKAVPTEPIDLARSVFPYWTSTVATRAMAALALVRATDICD